MKVINQRFFKKKTGNVRISFPNLREVDCPYLTRSYTINAHKYSSFVGAVPTWNTLSPVSVCADSVAVFHSSTCVDDFYFIYLVILLSYDL